MTVEEIAPKTGTREQILQAAMELFLENGYHGTSMRPIAQRAGVALGGIYNHFSGKEEIFTSVFLEMHPYRDFLAHINAAQGETLDEILHDAAGRLSKTIVAEKPEAFLKLMFIELVEFQARHIPQLFEQIFPHMAAMTNRLFTGREEIRELPPLIIVRSFLGLFFSYFITEWLFADLLPPEARENGLDHFVDIYLHGILKSNPAEGTK